jgi:hypothetical protein
MSIGKRAPPRVETWQPFPALHAVPLLVEPQAGD